MSHLFGADLPADRFQVGHVAFRRVLAHVGQASRTAGADLIVQVNVEAILGELAVKSNVATEDNPTRPSVQKDDRYRSGLPAGNYFGIGEARTGGQVSGLHVG